MSGHAAVRRPRHARIALTHPRGCGFRFDKRRCTLYHVSSSRIVPGMLNGNRDTFYPHYSFARATHTAEVSMTFTSVTTVAPSTHTVGTAAATGRSVRVAGVKRGTLLDTQIGRTTNFFKKYKLPHGYFYDATVRDAWTKTVVPVVTKRYISRILPHTRACWHTMEKLHLAPVATQVVVGCTSMNVATMIDLVCVDTASATKQYIPIEIKSGFNNYYYNCTDRMMRAPFETQTDCVFNQHQLQLLIGAELYRRSYWPSDRSKIGTPLLMRFRTDDDGNVVSDIHPLRKWATDSLPKAIQCLARNH